MSNIIVSGMICGLLYLAFLLVLSFNAAYESLMLDRLGDDSPIFLLDRMVIVIASMWIALTTVPDFVMSHARSVFGLFATEKAR